jgi:hypothetical protein
MTLAARIDPWLAARATRTAAVAAARARQDAFIVAQFPLLLARLETLLRQALGLHSGFTLSVSPLSLLVSNRSFATLDVTEMAVRASFTATPQTVRFTPALDFRDKDQFGLVECSIDFAFAPRAADAAAQALVERGIQLRAAGSPSLLVQRDGLWRDLTADDLEAALASFWLRR